MKLSEYKNDYYVFTGKLSDINRQIAFAGIALIWIFKKSDGINISICGELVLPTIFLASSLAFDMFQYIYQSITWAIFYRYHEKKTTEDIDVVAPIYLNYASWVLFSIKILLVIFSYFFIIRFLIEKLIHVNT